MVLLECTAGCGHAKEGKGLNHQQQGQHVKQQEDLHLSLLLPSYYGCSATSVPGCWAEGIHSVLCYLVHSVI